LEGTGGEDYGSLFDRLIWDWEQEKLEERFLRWVLEEEEEDERWMRGVEGGEKEEEKDCWGGRKREWGSEKKVRESGENQTEEGRRS